jgi:zinc transport system ATP-binding protein
MTTATAPSAEPIVSLRGATFGYADTAVVRQVTLDVYRGEVVAILGPNGAGKSTVVKGLLGLSDRLGGEVRLFGTPLDRFIRSGDHARLGYVPQRHTLSGSVRATAEEIVATGRLVRQGWLGRPSATDRQAIARSLEIVGLADRAGTDVSTLSGGQQRRVLIARALAAQPDVLLMDEPTAGVDTANQHVLAEVLGRLAAQGVTMLVVTHEMDAFAEVVTRVVVVDRGGVTFDGPRDVFLAREAEVLHEHHSHHHDDELLDVRPSLTGTAEAGPTGGAS